MIHLDGIRYLHPTTREILFFIGGEYLPWSKVDWTRRCAQ